MTQPEELWLFIELPGFTREWKSHFKSDDEYGKFQIYIASQPTDGNAMHGCGGFRKIRWADSARGMGKRGGLRIIYLQIPEIRVLVLTMIYGKNERDDLSAQDRNELAKMAAELKKELISRFDKDTGL